MNGWIVGWMIDGWGDVQTDKWMDGPKYGWMNVKMD